MPNLPKNSLEIKETTDESDSDYVLHTENHQISLYFDYAVKTNTGTRPSSITLYKNGSPFGSIRTSLINATKEKINTILLE